MGTRVVRPACGAEFPRRAAASGSRGDGYGSRVRQLSKREVVTAEALFAAYFQRLCIGILQVLRWQEGARSDG